jgi:two-component system, LytTR family, sensor kinase
MDWPENHTVKHNPILHAGFWATWIVFFSLLQNVGQSGGSLLNWLMYYIITLPVFVTHTYIIAYWLVPQTFMKGRYGLFIAGILIMLVAFSVIEMVISYESIFKFKKMIEVPSSGYLNFKNIIISGIGNHYIILVFMAIKVGRAWYHARSVEEVEQQRKLETAIEIYNYQLRPRVMHHLMAVLGAAMKKDNKKSPDLIIQISGFLNTFLHENKNEKVCFRDEVRLMEMYVKIFATALPDCIKSEFSAAGDFSSFSAPDFLFLPVLDYAFNLGTWCNNSVSCTVFVKEEHRQLYFSLSLSSNKQVDWEKNKDSEMLARRLKNNFPGLVTIKEERNETSWKLDVVLF